MNDTCATHRSLVFHCRHSSFNPSEAPPWDSRPVSGAGGVHYHLLHRPRSVPTALGPAPLATVILRDPHSKVSAKDPEFLVALSAIRPIHSLSPCIYPILPFPYCDPTEEFSPYEGEMFTITSSQTITLLQSAMRAMTSQETNVSPVFAMQEDFFQDV